MSPKSHSRRLARLCGTATVLALSGAVLAGPAAGQSMDYGSLEKLFGGPVTTSATGSPQRDTDVPVNMTIVTAEEIRRTGARDITGVLRHLPGVDVTQWGSDNSDISIRGFNQAYASGTLVMIDGRQVYADYNGFIPWSALPVELGAIRQIEVVKGPNDALFGFNAAGGAINIITYNPRYDDANRATLRVGNPSFGEVSGVATLKFGTGGGLRLSAGYRSNDDFSTPVPSAMAGATRQKNMRAAVDADVVYAIAEGVEIAAEASHTDAAVNEISPNYAMQASKYLTNALEGRLTADTAVGMLQFVGSSNWIRWKGASGPRVGQTAMNDQATVVRAEDVFNLGTDHTLRLAVAYRGNTVNTATLGGGSASQDVWSGSAMWQWQIAPTLTSTAALRLDRLLPDRSGASPTDHPIANDAWLRKYDELSYNGGIVWTATEEDTLRLIVSRGVELPSVVKSGALPTSSSDSSTAGNPHLKPSVVSNYEVAWNHEIAPAVARFQIAAFHEVKRNIASVGDRSIMGPDGTYVLPHNIGDSRAYGIEATANGTVAGGWHWSLGYRLEMVSDEFKPSTANFVDYQGMTPKHLVKTGLGWSDGVWEVDGFVNWQSRTSGLVISTNANGGGPFGAHSMSVGSYAAVDARIGWRLTDWATIAVSGQNLLQARQRQTAGPDVERQIYLSLILTK